MTMHPVTRLSGEEAAIDAKHLDIETVRHGAARARATHYEATTDEEKRLDKKVNRKLDCIVLSLLAIEFIASASRPAAEVPWMDINLHRAVLWH